MQTLKNFCLFFLLETVHPSFEQKHGTQDYDNEFLENRCNFNDLIKCFADVLDVWLIDLWNFRENILAVNQEVCEHHMNINYCVEYPGCSKLEILNASRLLTDTILLRQNAGSFLKSYFFTEFSCTWEGRQIVESHGSCLARHNLSETALIMSDLIEHNFVAKLRFESDSEYDSKSTPSPNIDKWFCRNLTNYANELYAMVKDVCSEMPAYLMCKSITDAFVNLYPKQMANCHVPCVTKPELLLIAPHNDEFTTPDSCKIPSGNYFLIVLLALFLN